MPKHKYAAVVVNRKAKAVDKIFHYSVPEPLQDSLVLGSVVSIPFGKNNQKLEGVVVDFPDAPGLEVLKEINGPVSSMPLFTPRMIELSRWLADHYLCPWVAALQAMLPAGLLLTGVLPVFSQAYCCYIKDPSARTMMTEKQRAAWDHLSAHPGAGVKEVLELGITRNVLQGMEKKGLIAINDGCYAKDPSARTMMTEKQRAAWDHLSAHPGADIKELLALGVARDVLQGMEKKGLLTIKKERVIKESGHEPVKKAALNQEQEEVFRAVMDERGRSGHKRPVLLHGVTGSGKTEIYLRLIEQVIAEGRQAILLVPEIALTPQMVNFVRRRIAQGVAVLHSGMSEAERRLAWQEISEGRRQVVLGARSAVFAPLPRLGLIIMDEEHEPSYKQENVPRFHAREVALQRCRLEDALFLAGSATPSVETYYHAKKGRWLLLELKKRFHRAPPPETRVVDMREELREGNRSIFSRALQEQLTLCLERGEQALLFLNRRGYYTFYSCRACGEALKCGHCAVPLAYHEREKKLKCHYCGFQRDLPRVCPACGSAAIRHFGSGTQRVADEIEKLFPAAKVLRLDSDVAAKRGSYEAVYEEMLSGRADVLVGTQMIVKGLDFPRVTLAAVVAADTTLNLPDWRAGERTFQLLTQLAGRAGRRERRGLAVIQTYSPQSPAVAAAAVQDYAAFYEQEIMLRELAQYPPFCSLLRLLFSAASAAQAAEAAKVMAGYLEFFLQGRGRVCGPAPAPVEKIKDLYRHQILLKGELPVLREAVRQARQKAEEEKLIAKGVRLQIDVEPLSIM